MPVATASSPADVLRDQHGIATRAQLRRAAVSPSQLKWEIQARRWQRINDRVVAMHNGPLTRRQALWAVELSAPRASLCGLTVLELYGLRNFAAAAVHVTVPKGSRVLPVPGVAVAVHETRRFPRADLWTIEALTVTGVARAVVDAACWSDDLLTASRIVVAGVRQLRVRPDLLRVELERAPGVQHRRALTLLVNDLEGGAQALSEVEFVAFCRRHGLPRPSLQARLDSGGRRRYLDAEFRTRAGGIVRVEVDGGIHLSLEVRARDTIKDNDASIDGRLVLRYASISIYRDDSDVVRQIRRALSEAAPETVRGTGRDHGLSRGQDAGRCRKMRRSSRT